MFRLFRWLGGSGLGLVCALLGAPAEPAAPGGVDCFLVVTGGELLEGAYPDAHTHFITRTLRPLGVRFVGSLVVDDVRPDMLEALRFATNRARLVLVTGGLGPTPNDITRETLSAFTGIPLVEKEEVVAALEQRLAQTRAQMRSNLRRQCLVPERGSYLANTQGTAAGLVFDLGGTTVVALPGPPRELQPMVRDALVPYLQAHFGVRKLGSTLTMRFVGVGQSQITQTLMEQVRVPEDIVVTSLFEGSRVDFTLTAPRDSLEEQGRLRHLETNLCQRLAEFYYADDGSTLEQVVLRALQKKGVRLAVAEVASGGSMAASLSAAPEAQPVLTGAFSAPTAEQLRVLLEGDPASWNAASNGEMRARCLAQAAAQHARSEWAIALGETEKGPENPGAWLAIKAGDRFHTQRLSIRGAGLVERNALVTPALDQLRRILRETK